MNIKQKKALYESIMKSVATELKKALNEGEESNGNYPAIEKYGLETIFESCNEANNADDAYIQKLKDSVEKSIERIEAKFPDKAKKFAESIKKAAKAGKKYLRILLIATIIAANNLNVLADNSRTTSGIGLTNVPKTEQVAADVSERVWCADVNTYLPVALLDAGQKATDIANHWKEQGYATRIVGTNNKEFPEEFKTKEALFSWIEQMEETSRKAGNKDAGYTDQSSYKLRKVISYSVDGVTDYYFVVTLN